jgi:holliday junction DNA helicase RuvA
MSILAHVRGVLAEKTAESVIVHVGGFGLAVQVPLSTMRVLPETGQEASLRTHLYIREGALSLFGFATTAEQRLFESLLSVTGVGPKAALNCLSFLSVAQLTSAITHADGDTLRRVPGVGKRTADRIVLELKDRLPESDAGDIQQPRIDDETIEALMFYGYSASEAAAAVASLPRDVEMSPEERTLQALQFFAPKPEQGRRRP